jgi:hypothetical protein
MKFEIQLFKYLGVAVGGAAYFGVGIPMLISANNDFLSTAGIILMLLGIAGIILFVRREVLLYFSNKKGDEKDGSKHETDNSTH